MERGYLMVVDSDDSSEHLNVLHPRPPTRPPLLGLDLQEPRCAERQCMQTFQPHVYLNWQTLADQVIRYFECPHKKVSVLLCQKKPSVCFVVIRLAIAKRQLERGEKDDCHSAQKGNATWHCATRPSA